MARFRKRPVVIDAVRWTGENVDEIRAFLAGQEDVGLVAVAPGLPIAVWNTEERQQIDVPVGHWLIRGIADEFYPCSPSVFEATYEPVE